MNHTTAMITEIQRLRQQGMTHEAYEAARRVYSVSRNPQATGIMFVTAIDELGYKLHEGQLHEASRILAALQRLVQRTDGITDEMHNQLKRCTQLVEQATSLKDRRNGLPQHLQMGIWGEELAADYLRAKGYVILERDWHSQHRDIDIIARHRGQIVFVEVKTRSSTDYADPETAVNYKKLRHLRQAINHYLHFRGLNADWRFDVITVVGTPDTPAPQINHIEDFPLI